MQTDEDGVHSADAWTDDENTLKPPLVVAKVSSKNQAGPLIRLNQFVDSGRKLISLSAHIHERSYFAISHVWGDATWRSLECLDH